MAWDFETDPEYQEELDWVDDFVREEVEPLDFVIEHPYDMNDPIRKELIPPLQEKVKDRGPVGAATSGPSSAARATARSSWRCSTRSSAAAALRVDRVRLPGAGLGQRRDPRPLRHARAEGALPRAAARQRDRLVLLDDRAAGRRRPQGVHAPGPSSTATSGSSTARSGSRSNARFVVVPHRDGGHRPGQPAVPADVDVHRARPTRRASRSSATSASATSSAGDGTHAYIRYNDVRVPAREPARRPRAARSSSPRPASAAAASTTPCAPSAMVQRALRHDVRAGRVAAHAGRAARPQADGAGDDRRLVDRDGAVPPAGACARRGASTSTRTTSGCARTSRR